QLRLPRGMGAVHGTAGRRDEAVLRRPRSPRHAVEPGAACRAPRRRFGDAHARVDPPAGDRLHARAHGGAPGRCGVGSRSVHHLSGTGDRVHARQHRDPEGSRRGAAGHGSDIRGETVPRPRARGRRRAGQLLARQDSRVGEVEMKRILVAIIIAALAASAAAQRKAARDAAPPRPLYDVVEKGIVELQDAMTRGDVTSKDLVASYLARIAAYDRSGPALNAMIALNPTALD